jgi:CheY-like chemotaxis protein
MIGMSGIELRDVMRNDTDLARIPVVLATSAPEEYQRI